MSNVPITTPPSLSTDCLLPGTNRNSNLSPDTHSLESQLVLATFNNYNSSLGNGFHHAPLYRRLNTCYMWPNPPTSAQHRLSSPTQLHESPNQTILQLPVSPERHGDCLVRGNPYMQQLSSPSTRPPDNSRACNNA